MRYTYVCRYCNSEIGTIENNWVTEVRLGISILTPQEYADIISYDSNLKGATIRTICDFCQGALEQHPELFLERSPLQ